MTDVVEGALSRRFRRKVGIGMALATSRLVNTWRLYLQQHPPSSRRPVQLRTSELGCVKHAWFPAQWVDLILTLSWGPISVLGDHGDHIQPLLYTEHPAIYSLYNFQHYGRSWASVMITPSTKVGVQYRPRSCMGESLSPPAPWERARIARHVRTLLR